MLFRFTGMGRSGDTPSIAALFGPCLIVVQVLRTDERSHRSYELTTIHVLLDLNNVNRLCAFDILRCGPFLLEFRLVNKWKGRSRSGTT